MQTKRPTRRSVSIATPSDFAAETRDRFKALRDSKPASRRPTPVQSPANGILSGSRRLKARSRIKTPVADATFRLFLHASELPPPNGFELRLREEGEHTSGGFYRKSDSKFVSSWFHVLAVTKDAWLIAYIPTDCRRISSWLVPFSEAMRTPALLRKAGCRVGSARLLVEMITGLAPRYPSS